MQVVMKHSWIGMIGIVAMTISSSALAWRYKCDPEHAAGCKTVCTDKGGTWDSTKIECTLAIIAKPFPTLAEFERLQTTQTSPSPRTGASAVLPKSSK